MGFVATASSASYFDGKTPLLCSVHQLFECDAPNACQAVSPEQVAGFSHLNVDFKSKLVTRAGVDSEQKSTIDAVEQIDGKLILYGIEDGQADVRDGAGWSMSIMDPEGTMVTAIAGDGFAIVALGACVPKP
jgi:Ni,Fe-hydrogenase I small subunit